MEAQRQTTHSTWHVPTDVITRSDLREGAKLTYVLLWNLAACRPTTVSITKAHLAAELGGSERAAGRWLQSLVDVGMIEILDNHKGTITLAVAQPRPASKPHVARGDPQRELTFSDQNRGGSAANLASPYVGDIGGCCATPSDIDTVPFVRPPMSKSKRAQASSDVMVSRGGSAAEAPPALGNLVDQALSRLPDTNARADRVEARILHWLQLLEDPSLRSAPLLKIAWAIERGRVRLETMSGVMARARELESAGELRTTKGRYVVQAMKRHFQERGVPWSIDKE